MRQESGTEAERLAYDTTGLPVLSTWEVTSGSGQGNKYTWGGSAWVQTHSSGAALVSDAALDYTPYSDATYDYYCEAVPGTALTTAAWRIVRKNRSTGRWQHASLGAFSNAATDLATVQGAFA